MKVLEVKIDGKVVYSESLVGDIIAGKLMQVKAWAKMKARGKSFEVNIKKQDKEIDDNFTTPENKIIFNVIHAYELRKRGWSIAQIAAKYRQSKYLTDKKIRDYETTDL